MKIRMKVSVSGPRHDGHDWPLLGEELDVPDWEGAELCSSGLATPVAERKTEKAVPPKAESRKPDQAKKRPQAKKSTRSDD